MKTRNDYKNAALGSLKGRWAPVVIATLVYLAIAALYGACGRSEQSSLMTVASLVNLFVFVPLQAGYNNAIREYCHGSGTQPVSRMFNITIGNYKHILGGMLLMTLFVMLWSLLLIVPGVIMAIAYSMTPYILVDEPQLSVMDALRKSEQMMRGRKMEFFLLELSFIGWFLLSCITFGVGLLWLEPYMTGTIAAYYEDLKKEFEG